MKSLIIVICLAVTMSLAVFSEFSRAETLSTKAPVAFLFEPRSQTILFAKDADQPFAPGSLAKVMTAAVVFKAEKDGELRPGQLCKVSEHAWRTGGAPSRGSTMFAAIKSEIGIDDLLRGLLIHNANDAAIVLAECLDGSEEAFAERMNTLAAAIGMTGTHFANPTGFADPSAKTTARDLVRLGTYVLEQYPARYGLFSEQEFTWNKIYQRNKNPLIGEIRGLDGLGAGQDDADGYAGLASVERDGRRIFAVVAGLPSSDARIQAMKEVVEGSWEYFGVSRLFAKGEAVGEARAFGGTASVVPLIAAEDIDVLLPRGDTLNYRLRIVYHGPLIAPIEAGTQAGELRVIGQDGIVFRGALVTGTAVPRGTTSERALDGLMTLLFGWL